jgi:hypothetical protein
LVRIFEKSWGQKSWNFLLELGSKGLECMNEDGFKWAGILRMN